MHKIIQLSFFIQLLKRSIIKLILRLFYSQLLSTLYYQQKSITDLPMKVLTASKISYSPSQFIHTPMQNIFDTLVAACSDILQEEQQTTENRKEDVQDTEDQPPKDHPTREQSPNREEQPAKEQQPTQEKHQTNDILTPRQEKTAMQVEVEQYFEQDQNWSQFENAIINHIKIKNKPVEQIILIEQTSSEQSQQKQYPPNRKTVTTHQKTNLTEQKHSPSGSRLSTPPQRIQDKKPEKESKQLQSRPLKLICKPPQSKTQTISKAKSSAAQSKQIAQQTKKAEMAKQVLSKVNINELKAKLNFNTDPNEAPKPPKQPESKHIIQQNTLQRSQQERKPAPKSIQIPPPSTIASNIEKQLSDFSISINDEKLLEQSTGKVAKKGGKNERQIEMKPQLSQDQARILQRRKKQEDGKVDLGALTLDEVVQHCYKRQIISEQLYIEYIATSSQQSIINFINLFIKNNLKLWDFQQYKITIMDHRRLAEYLVRVFPQHYKIYSPDSVEKNLKEFLENLYGLPQHKYKKLLDSLDGQSKVSEWNMLRIKYQKYANIPVKIMPLPNTAYSPHLPSTPTPAKTFNPPNQSKIIKKQIFSHQDDDIPQQNHKRVPLLEGIERTEKKRPLNSVYESKQRKPQQQLDNEMRLASLKNQLKRKKIN